MSDFWKTSVTARIVVILSCAMVIVWLLLESVDLYFRYFEAQTELRRELTWQLGSIAKEESRRYECAVGQGRVLLSWWGGLNERILFRPSDPVALQHAIFVPFEDARGDRALVARAREVVELYGRADPRTRKDTFLILPAEGIVLFEPDGLSDDEIQCRVRMLTALRRSPKQSTVDWGAPVRASTGDILSAAVVVDPQSDVGAGKIVKVGDFPAIARALGLGASLHFALLAQAGNMFRIEVAGTSANAPPAISLPLKSDRQQWTRNGNYEITCLPLSGPDWQMVAAYPVNTITRKALSLLPLTAHWKFIVLLALIAFVYATLQAQLGRPLRQFVKLIDAQCGGDPGRRIQTSRRDELGQIARACNSLLGTIGAYYKTLESKVHERTRELAEAKRLAESASHRKNEHIASISHELRTPLNGIVGALSLLDRSELQSGQRELVRVAQQSSIYLLGIVNNVLDFSRIEVGQLELSVVRTDLFALLDQAMLTIHIRAHEKGLGLRTLVAADVPRTLLLDGLRVQQILINLLGNAVKFTERGHVHLTVERRANMLALVVEDTGMGIPEEYKLDIFKPFVQVRTHDSGTGLGLSIAARLAKLMNGEIRLDSELGNGTRFTVLLPLQSGGDLPARLTGRVVAPDTLHTQLRIWGVDAEGGDNPLFPIRELCYLPGKLWDKVVLALRGETVREEAASKAICPWSLKILVVDDVEMNRDIVSKMLRKLGQQTGTATSGRLALELGRSQVFDLVLMDVRMPELDGMATARIWRHDDQGVLDPDTPIVALTANASPAEHERANEAGMNGYLTKPVSLEQLINMINHVAALQLARGLDLAPNTEFCSSLCDMNEAAMRQKLHKALVDLQKQIDDARRTTDATAILNGLHAMKGCAGQGGLDLVYEAAERYERRVRSGLRLSCQDVRYLAKLISTQFA
ncbi:two component system sensor kinase [Burkholderia sp. Bp9126]|nr:two component system sensor kinase [Burkholderia sp. Bp9126]